MMQFLDFRLLDWKSEVWNLDMFVYQILPQDTSRLWSLCLQSADLFWSFRPVIRFRKKQRRALTRYPAKTAKMEKRLFWARTLEQQWENQRIQQW